MEKKAWNKNILESRGNYGKTDKRRIRRKEQVMPATLFNCSTALVSGGRSTGTAWHLPLMNVL
jgi:hypothetical protein